MLGVWHCYGYNWDHGQQGEVKMTNVQNVMGVVAT